MYKIRKLDEQAVENAEKKWNSIAKPLHSLGAVSYTHLRAHET
mgnify:FL=1